MKKIIVGAFAFAFAAGVFRVTGGPDPGTPVALEEGKPAETENSAPSGRISERKQASRPEGLDPNRLFDRAYENDPDVQAIASKAGVPPACVIAAAKHALHQTPIEEGDCPQPGDVGTFPTLAVGATHPYNQYSNSELESLATSEPAAAVILARRTESDAEAREWYERAVVLSGIAEPLIEWMTNRSVGGLSFDDGGLDVEYAKRGYELSLTAAAFGGESDSTIRTYQEKLKSEGVDLAPIEQRAAEQVARLRAERLEIIGGERP